MQRVSFRNALPFLMRANCLGERSISSKAVKTVDATLPLVAAAGDKFTAHFYGRMFKAHPELLDIFNTTNQKTGRQQKALFSSIAAAATSVLTTGELPHVMLEPVHHKHCALNVTPEQYKVVGEHIVGTIVDLLNPPQEVLDAWTELYMDMAEECINRSEELYTEVESKPGGWRGTREFVLQAKEVKSASVTQFTFVPKDGKPVCSYQPGQYTTIWLKGKDWTNRQPRHYTLVNPPNEKTYTIAVKKDNHGLVSQYLHDELLPLDVVELSPPFGDFHIEKAATIWNLEGDVPVVFISAGVGITPVLSMLSSIKHSSRPVVWLHGARCGREHPFRDYLQGLAKNTTSNTFTRRVWYVEPDDRDFQGDESDNHAQFHFQGKMDLTDVQNILPLDQAKVMYFICGPQGFMEEQQQVLISMGVPKDQIAFEDFRANS